MLNIYRYMRFKVIYRDANIYVIYFVQTYILYVTRNNLTLKITIQAYLCIFIHVQFL